MHTKSISLKTAAKKLGVGHLTLFKFLRGQQLLQARGPLRNTPHPAYIKQGLFETIEIEYTTGPVRRRYIKTLVTAQGMDTIAVLLADRKRATPTG